MDDEMRMFIDRVSTMVNGQVHVLFDGQLGLVDLDTNNMYFGPSPIFYNTTMYTIFLARLDRVMATKGWDW
jgi:hypothetical protein